MKEAKERSLKNDLDERFDRIVELARHMCDELVDDPESLVVSSTYSGVTGCIEVVGPQDEVSKIFGIRKATIMAIETVVNNVSSKNGFRVIINILNSESKLRMMNKTEFYEED